MERQQRKRETRIRQRLPVRVGGSRTEPGAIGMTRDLSAGGLCLSAQVPHAPGTRLRIKLRLPDDFICRVEGVVVWWAGESATAEFPALMGIRIESASPEYLTAVAAQARPVGGTISGALEEVRKDPGTPPPPDAEVPGKPIRAKSHAPGSLTGKPRTKAARCRLIAVTGGPASRKPELLQRLRRQFSEHLILLPDLSSIPHAAVIGRAGPEVLRSQQRAVVERVLEMEYAAIEGAQYPLALCQFTTLDCLAAWAGGEAAFWAHLRTTRELALRRYDMAIHLRPPDNRDGGSPAIMRSHRELEVPWVGHPRREIIEWTADFEQQLARVVTLVQGRLPKGA